MIYGMFAKAYSFVHRITTLLSCFKGIGMHILKKMYKIESFRKHWFCD